MKKVIKILVAFYLFQTILSCNNNTCSDCTPTVIKLIYDETTVRLYNTADFESSIAKNKLPIENFGIELGLKFNKESLANNTFNFRKLGFSSTYACPGPSYKYVDTIKKMVISVKNKQTDEISDISNQLSGYYKNRTTKTTLSKLVEAAKKNINGDQIELRLNFSDTSNIPSKATFIVKVILESGKEFTKESKEINFI